MAQVKHSEHRQVVSFERKANGERENQYRAKQFYFNETSGCRDYDNCQ